MLRKYTKLFGNIIFVLVMAAMVMVVFFSVGGKLNKDGIPKISKYSLMVVLSGSMSPVFEAGDVIIVSTDKKKQYDKGDIITFKDAEENKRIITHRIVEVINNQNKIQYRTKGDANDSVDPSLTLHQNIIGQEKMHIPYFGRVVEFSKTKQGFIVLIVIPALVIIFSELFGVVRAINAEVEHKKREVV